MKPTAHVIALIAAAAWGGSEQPPKDVKPAISQKTRVENLQPRIEQAFRLSETEQVKILLVPGYPIGERCVIYTNATSSTMQCREELPHEQ